jgi:NodT family efflux transporter outer membrane factor (OMF) lipoprotein
MIKNTLTRGISVGALAVLASACGHLPIAQPAFNAMKGERANMPTDWTVAEMNGDTSAMLADYSVFNDPQLISYVQEALKNNRTVRGSLETLRQSELALQSTRSRLFPQLTASVSSTSSTPTDNFNLTGPLYGFRMNGSYDVDIMGDLNASIQASSAGLRSTAATVEQTRRQIAQQTARAYFAVIEQQMQLDLEKRSYERSQQSYRITETRFQAGSIDKGEYVNAQAGLKQAEDSILAAENSARSAVRALEVILGRFPQNKLSITGALPEPPPAPPLGLPELTIRSRPDVVAAELQMIQTFSAQRRAQMLPWPQLDANLALGVSNSASVNASDLFDFDALAFTIGATLFQTIFDGGAIDAQVKTADSQVRAALINYGGRIINDYAEIVNAIDQFNNLESRQRASQANSEARAEVLRLAELKYQEGSVSLFELLSQRDQADAAESALITLRRSRLEQWLTLHTALGGNPTQAMPLPTVKNVADSGKHG